jgi:hypothetical protein
MQTVIGSRTKCTVGISVNASASHQKAIDRKFTAGKSTDVFKLFLLFFILIWSLPIEDGN